MLHAITLSVSKVHLDKIIQVCKVCCITLHFKLRDDNTGAMKDNRQKLKMAELVKKTGVPKSTILYYVKEGLLPAPEKTSHNMAYYDASYVDRIKAIKALQNRYYPLSRIKEFLRVVDAGGTSDMVLKMDNAVFQQKIKPDKFYTRQEFIKNTGLSDTMLKKVEKIKLILPLERAGKKQYDEEDARMARIIVGTQIMGLELEIFKVYTDCAEKISKHEMAIRKRVIKNRTIHSKLHITTFLADVSDELRTYLFRRYLQKRVEAEIKKSLNKD